MKIWSGKNLDGLRHVSCPLNHLKSIIQLVFGVKYDPDEMHVWPWQQNKRNWSTFVADSGCLTALDARAPENRKDEDKATHLCLKPHVLQELDLLNPSPVLTLPFQSLVTKTKTSTIQNQQLHLEKKEWGNQDRKRGFRSYLRIAAGLMKVSHTHTHTGTCRSACCCMFWGFGSVSIHAESLTLQTSSVLQGVKVARDTQGFSHFHKKQPRRKNHKPDLFKTSAVLEILHLI